MCVHACVCIICEYFNVELVYELIKIGYKMCLSIQTREGGERKALTLSHESSSKPFGRNILRDQDEGRANRLRNNSNHPAV